MNCFCGMVDRRKALSLISSRDHCQRSSSSRISDTPRAGFEPVQNQSSGFVEWSCAVVITITPRRHTTFFFSFSETSVFTYIGVKPELELCFILSYIGSVITNFTPRKVKNFWLLKNSYGVYSEFWILLHMLYKW